MRSLSTSPTPPFPSPGFLLRLFLLCLCVTVYVRADSHCVHTVPSSARFPTFVLDGLVAVASSS
jgi:hypothetical protein